MKVPKNTMTQIMKYLFLLPVFNNAKPQGINLGELQQAIQLSHHRRRRTKQDVEIAKENIRNKIIVDFDETIPNNIYDNEIRLEAFYKKLQKNQKVGSNPIIFSENINPLPEQIPIQSTHTYDEIIYAPHPEQNKHKKTHKPKDEQREYFRNSMTDENITLP
jgi:hypothetical protein